MPTLWSLEASNVLTVLARRGKLTEQERDHGLELLGKLRFKVDHEAATLAFKSLTLLAVKYQLSVYDATYLELTQRRQLPLACKDGALRQAAERSGVRLWSTL